MRHVVGVKRRGFAQHQFLLMLHVRTGRIADVPIHPGIDPELKRTLANVVSHSLRVRGSHWQLVQSIAVRINQQGPVETRRRFGDVQIAQQRTGEAWRPCTGNGKPNSRLPESPHCGRRAGTEVLFWIEQSAVNIRHDQCHARLGIRASHYRSSEPSRFSRRQR